MLRVSRAEAAAGRTALAGWLITLTRRALMTTAARKITQRREQGQGAHPVFFRGFAVLPSRLRPLTGGTCFRCHPRCPRNHPQPSGCGRRSIAPKDTLIGESHFPDPECHPGPSAAHSLADRKRQAPSHSPNLVTLIPGPGRLSRPLIPMYQSIPLRCDAPSNEPPHPPAQRRQPRPPPPTSARPLAKPRPPRRISQSPSLTEGPPRHSRQPRSPLQFRRGESASPAISAPADPISMISAYDRHRVSRKSSRSSANPPRTAAIP